MTLEVRLYGKLRRSVPGSRVDQDCVLHVEIQSGDTVQKVLARLGISSDLVSNLFLNGELSDLRRRVNTGGRLGVFPDDMALLYKWYFDKKV